MVAEQPGMDGLNQHIELNLQKDSRVQAAYREWTELLESLDDIPLREEPGIPMTTLMLGNANVTRWLIRFNGAIKLDRVSSFCRTLMKRPSVIDASVIDCSDGSITIRILTSGGIEMDALSKGIAEMRRSLHSDSQLQIQLIHDLALH